MFHQRPTDYSSSGVKSTSLRKFAVISDEQTMETTFWHKLDDQASEIISGGGDVSALDLGWSIRFGDVRRPSP